jgi:hypothetical protein
MTRIDLEEEKSDREYERKFLDLRMKPPNYLEYAQKSEVWSHLMM